MKRKVAIIANTLNPDNKTIMSAIRRILLGEPGPVALQFYVDPWQMPVHCNDLVEISLISIYSIQSNGVLQILGYAKGLEREVTLTYSPRTWDGHLQYEE